MHRDRVALGELARVGDHLQVTGPLRTAWDLARRLDRVEGVVAVDRLANTHRFNPDLLLNFLVHYRGARGNDRVPEVLAHAARLVDRGWRIYRYTKYEIHGEPHRIVDEIGLARAS